jgi:hypothetical protein
MKILLYFAVIFDITFGLARLYQFRTEEGILWLCLGAMMLDAAWEGK